MLQKTWNWLRSLLGTHNRDAQQHLPALSHQPQPSSAADFVAETDAYDPTLLERASEYWQDEDWPSLAAIGQEPLELHPDRGTLTVLVAAALSQQGKIDAAKQLVQQARVWGETKQQIARVFIAGAHRNLGQAAAAAGLASRAEEHLRNARMLSGVKDQP